MSKFENILKLIGRLAIAAIFIWAAWGKVLNPSSTINHIQSAGIPAAGLVYALTVALEALGGALIVIGWRARLAAFALFLFLIPATYLFHFDLGNRLQMSMALKNIGLMGGLLYIMAAGPGKFSIGKS